MPRWPQGRNALWTSFKILCDAQPCGERDLLEEFEVRPSWGSRGSIRHDFRTSEVDLGECARLRVVVSSCSTLRSCQDSPRDSGSTPSGTIDALQKPNGGVRGIVAGDVFRRLVARTIAQQLGPAIERATSPFQYALSTRAGTECIAHAIQALTDLDPSATVLSIDGIGASSGHVARLVACGWGRFSIAS